eukprot:TRINITY_DN6108_c0_g1_i1.p1 TRINITY_DN6108_c0_g1~~TRINITY_DN6108_c0_g1_i1.p1  ORF type:complete len:574 (+),score=238.03 TRINITY_DN6108_c0_g1_i1:90-1811(+)
MPSKAANTVLWVKYDSTSPWWPAKVTVVEGDVEGRPDPPRDTLVYFYQTYNGMWVDVDDPETVKDLAEDQLQGDEAKRRIDEANGDESLAAAIAEALEDVKGGGTVLDLQALSDLQDAQQDEEADGEAAPTAEGSQEVPPTEGTSTQETAGPTQDGEDDDDDDSAAVMGKKSKKDKKDKKGKKEKKEKKDKKDKKEKKERKDEKRAREEEEDEGDDAPSQKKSKPEPKQSTYQTRMTDREERRRLDTMKSPLGTRDLQGFHEQLKLAIKNRCLTDQRSILNKLTEFAPTLSQLKDTGIGKTVISLVNTPLQPLAKVLIQMWKSLLPEPPQVAVRDHYQPVPQRSGYDDAPSAREATFSQPFPSQDEESPTPAEPLFDGGVPEATQPRIEDGSQASVEDVGVSQANNRIGVMQQRLIQAFKTPGPEGKIVARAMNTPFVEFVSADIVNQLLMSIANADQQRAKFREILSNLQDTKNSWFRDHILSKPDPYEVVTTMSASEMANPERRDEIKETTEYERDAMRTDLTKRAETDQFKCGRCKKNRTTYFQMQTRSADEPMTTFVTCLDCGNAWKFC